MKEEEEEEEKEEGAAGGTEKNGGRCTGGRGGGGERGGEGGSEETNQHLPNRFWLGPWVKCCIARGPYSSRQEYGPWGSTHDGRVG